MGTLRRNGLWNHHDFPPLMGPRECRGYACVLLSTHYHNPKEAWLMHSYCFLPTMGTPNRQGVSTHIDFHHNSYPKNGAVISSYRSLYYGF